MEKYFDFDEIGKRTPYRTPDGFFEDFQQKMMERVKRRKRHIRLCVAAVTAAAALLAGWVFMPPFRQTEPVEGGKTILELGSTTDPVEKWIRGMSDEELEELVNFSENDVFLNQVKSALELKS